jgi:glutamine kinase
MSLNTISNFTKGSSLLYLKDKLKYFKIPNTYLFTVNDWFFKKENILNIIPKKFIGCKLLAVRSSSINEDKKSFSYAGRYYSQLFVDINNKKKLIEAIEKVILKYDKKNIYKNQIILQEMILKPNLSGVIFSREPNTNAPYYVINYDDISRLTNTVTSGSSKFSNKSLNIYREKFYKLRSPRFKKLIKGVREIEKIFNTEELDIEFCIKKLDIYLLQVRPLTNLKKWNKNDEKHFSKTLNLIEKKIRIKSKKTPGIFGTKNVFGQMPDWNPAEIIGINPKPLAYSLYKKLITEKTWAIARERMNYKKPKDQSLMVNFGGLPYINTRLSFNSFLPKELNNTISKKLINHWLKRLKYNPQLHDKIEFEIAITSFSFDIEKKIKVLLGNLFNETEKKIFKTNLTKQFVEILDKSNLGSIDYNLKLVNLLKLKQEKFNYNSSISELIKDTIKYGTIPFAILARHAFISKSILNSLQNLKIISNSDINKFYLGISTVATDFVQDVYYLKKGIITKTKFNKLYGHLRPGTYDIESKRYDEKNYINFFNLKDVKTKKKENFLNNYQKNKIFILLKKFNIKISVDELINYIKKSISSREYAKFMFTKNVSQILKIIKNKNLNRGFNISELSFLEIKDFYKNLTKSDLLIKKNKIFLNKKKYNVSKSIKLPQIIHDKTGAFVAPFQMNLPNYISNKKVTGETFDLNKNSKKKLNNRIILIENADPGYDWIFTYKIKGLITKYGGVNSHMAIRCRELNIPAAIGCGEQIYTRIKSAKQLVLDCSENKINFTDI